MIEMVVVLAVIAILAAILTPIITSYVDRARVNAATNDVKNITAAIIQYNTDTKVWPIYTSAAQSQINGTVYEMLKGPGDTPTGTSWGGIGTFGTTVGNLDTLLNTNFLTRSGWKGSYLQIASDPWGTAYFVTANHLKPDSTLAAFVVSAGPNQNLDTDPNQAKTASITVGNDDIVVRIR
jgi:type II secretory pathway pseudopilin PulG